MDDDNDMVPLVEVPYLLNKQYGQPRGLGYSRLYAAVIAGKVPHRRDPNSRLFVKRADLPDIAKTMRLVPAEKIAA